MLKIDSIHSMDEYMDLLSVSDTIYIDADRLDAAVKDSMYVAEDMRLLALLELRIASAGSYSSLEPEYIIEYLMDIGVDMDKRFTSRKTKGYSLDMKKVVDPLIESGVAVDLLTAYKKFRSYKTYSNFLRKLNSQRTTFISTSDGRKLFPYSTHIEERENCRVYYHDIAVVSIPKVYSSIITAPREQYHLAWCDYPQADWRFAYNLFIADESNIEQMRQNDDAYEGLARLIEGDSFDPKVFSETRKDYKVNCLKTFYNSQDNRAIPTKMRNYFHSRQRYAKYFHDLSTLYQFKVPIPCTSYFGYTQLLPEAPYPDAFISKGLNTPIQTFTSHVVNETIFGILQRFWDLGYTKDDINIYYVRHDEPVFYFSDNILKDAWVFKDCSEIYVEGFSPIKLDFYFGDNYGEQSSVLTEQVRMNIDKHPERIHSYAPGPMHPYNPVPAVESLYVQFFVVKQNEEMCGYHVVYFDYRTRKTTVVDTSKTTMIDAFYDTLNTMLEKLNYPAYLLVRNDGLELIDAVGPDESVFLKVISKYDSGVAVVSYDDVD